MKPLCWVNSNGEVIYIPRRTYQIPCSFDLSDFPFDSQSCVIMLGSWAYLQNELDIHLKLNGTDKTFYVGHSDWSLVNFNISRKAKIYGSNTVPFVELHVNIGLKRRPKYFYYMFILPADVFLFILPIVHFLPPLREGKLILCK